MKLQWMRHRSGCVDVLLWWMPAHCFYLFFEKRTAGKKTAMTIMPSLLRRCFVVIAL